MNIFSDTNSLILLWLLIRRRRRRRQQYELEEDEEPATLHQQNKDQGNRRPSIHRQQNVVQKRQKPLVRRRLNIAPKTQGTLEQQNVAADSQQPGIANEDPGPSTSVEQDVARDAHEPTSLQDTAPTADGVAKRRKYWKNPYLTSVRAKWKIFQNNLKEDPGKFRDYYGLSVDSFYDILAKIEKRITGSDTNMREALDPEAKLAATVRYMSKGDCYREVSEEFGVGHSTMSVIVRCVTTALWEEVRSPYMDELNAEEMLKMSDDCERKTGLLHCLGSVGGRYIRFKQRNPSSDKFFELSRNFHAAAVVAVVDCNFFFRYVDVAGYKEDSNLFRATSLGTKLYSGTLDLPKPKEVAGFPRPLPYVFATKDFPLEEFIMRPYHLTKRSTPDKELFNDKLEKAVAPFDTALKLMASRWTVLQRPFEMASEGMFRVVKACCILHNYVGQREGFPSVDDSSPGPFHPLDVDAGGSSYTGRRVRELFSNYYRYAGTLGQLQGVEDASGSVSSSDESQ